MNVQRFYDLVLELTGRSERKRFGAERPTQDQEHLLEAYLRELKEFTQSRPRQTKEIPDPNRSKSLLFNAVLRVLGIKTVSLDFFVRVLGEVNFGSEETFARAVEDFKKVGMLEYGNFRFCYKQLREADASRLTELWSKYYPTSEQLQERRKRLSNRLPVRGLERIQPDLLFTLGYLAVEHLAKVNEARKRMKEILDQLEAEVGTEDDSFEMLLRRKKVLAQWRELQGTVNLREATDVAAGPLYQRARPTEVIKTLKARLVTFNKNDIDRSRRIGQLNTSVYLATGDMDLYVATSMRDLAHFASMARFVDELFAETDLKEFNVRYFDPTQSFVDDRIHKGLIECLMVKRSRITVYNAQEEDTFGKDAEASISLALGKPVVVYVARFFRTHLADAYATLDELREATPQQMVEGLIEAGQLPPADRALLGELNLTKGRVITSWAHRTVRPKLDDQDLAQVLYECRYHGYEPPEKSVNDETACRDFALDRIRKHETRAVQFAEAHPLAVQTTLKTGVPNGVMVARDIRTTASLIRHLLLGDMTYEIDETDREKNILLREGLTRSPVRIVAMNDVLTTAFWDSYLKELQQ